MQDNTQGLRMTEAEKMSLENLTLRLEVIHSNAEREAAPIIAAREQLGRAIGDRLGVDARAVTFDLNTGAVLPRAEAPPAAEPSNAED